MHMDSIKSWNIDLYKNVKQNRAEAIQLEKEEDRVVNTVGFMEMLLHVEYSPFVFSFEKEKGRLLVQNTHSNIDEPLIAQSGSGRSMLKTWISNKLKKQYEIFEKKRDDTYAASSGSSAGKPGGSFDQLGKSIYMITEALDFNMKYTEPKV